MGVNEMTKLVNRKYEFKRSKNKSCYMTWSYKTTEEKFQYCHFYHCGVKCDVKLLRWTHTSTQTKQITPNA